MVLLGSSGVGKTHIAMAMCYTAVQADLKIRLINASDVILQLLTAQRKDKDKDKSTMQLGVFSTQNTGY
ncbi:MAG: DNA replication protein DnaC [Candidatus Endobugula sp.]|jgi:DNA replication protein DnaC